MKRDFLFILDKDGVSKDLNKDREKSIIEPIFHLYLEKLHDDTDENSILTDVSGILARDIAHRYEHGDVEATDNYTGTLIKNLLDDKVAYNMELYEHDTLMGFESKVFIVVDFENENVYSLSSDIDGNYHVESVNDKDFVDEIIQGTEIYKYIDPNKGFKEQFNSMVSAFPKR